MEELGCNNEGLDKRLVGDTRDKGHRTSIQFFKGAFHGMIVIFSKSEH
jgi:hypothetical protein